MKWADLAALAAITAGAFGTVSAPPLPTEWSRGRPRRNTGWTNARYQRAARKRRNQQLNRRAHRG